MSNDNVDVTIQSKSIHKSQKVEKTKRPTDEWMDEGVLYPYKGILLNSKKESGATT